MLFKRWLGRNRWGVNRTHYRLKHVWKEPNGYDTTIKIYNEVVKDKVPLIFPNKNYVKWYMCGPTVYDASHIGHASCYVKQDIIHRILKEHFNIHPVVAIGVTDVAEQINKKSTLLNKPPWEITMKYTTEFFEQMNALNVLPPSFKLRVSDHIEVIHNFVDLLVRRRVAYKGTDGSVYFSTEADPNYGRFREPHETQDGQSYSGKRNPRDFALWKVEKKYLSLHSPWGKGLPGWHIECSAMASHVFGSTVDMHSGGSDLIFPHHENEESQSTCFHKCDQWVNYWIHTGLMNIGDVKMSKSLGNFIPISEFLKHHRSDHLRMFCFMSSYRSELSYEETKFQLAVDTCAKINSFLDSADSYITGKWTLGNVKESELLEEMEKTKEIVQKHLANDFGTPEALKAIMLLVKSGTKMLHEKTTETSSRSPATIAALTSYVRDFFRSFGFTFTEAIVKSESTSPIDTVITAAVNVRSRVREHVLQIPRSQNRDNLLLLCDKFRDKLLVSGVVVSDFAQGQSHWSFKSSSAENKLLLKEVIDYTVWFRDEIEKRLSTISNDQLVFELAEVSRYIQMYFGTLGVNIQETVKGSSEWSFPRVNESVPPMLEGVLHSSLQFHSQVKEAVEGIADGNKKEELLILCESFISDLDEHGVCVDEKSKSFEVDVEKGTSIIHKAVNILAHLRLQGHIVALLTNDNELKEKLNQKIGRNKKLLGSFGFYIMKSDPYFLPTWKQKYYTVNKTVLMNIVDITVSLLIDFARYGKATDDSVAKRVLLDLSDCAIADLGSLGIEIASLGLGDTKWSFKPSRGANEFPLCCSPRLAMAQEC